jgi:hypothetical protein
MVIRSPTVWQVGIAAGVVEVVELTLGTVGWTGAEVVVVVGAGVGEVGEVVDVEETVGVADGLAEPHAAQKQVKSAKATHSAALTLTF